MRTVSMRDGSHSVPCALKDYLGKGGGCCSFADLTQQECQIAFRYWAACVHKDTTHTPSKQYDQCPLLWCRKTFDNVNSYLAHVSACPRLSNGWYYCPACDRPEKFVPPLAKVGEVLQGPVQKKETKLRRAVAFFKQFGGSKSFSRQTSSYSSSVCKSNALQRWHMNRRIRDKSELEARSSKSWLHDLDIMYHSLDSGEHLDVVSLKNSNLFGTDNMMQVDATDYKNCQEPKYLGESGNLVELCGSELTRSELSTERPSRVISSFLMDIDELESFDPISTPSSPLTIRESTFTPLSDLVSPISPLVSRGFPDLQNPLSPIGSGALSDLLSPISPMETSLIQWPTQNRIRKPVLSVATNTQSVASRTSELPSQKLVQRNSEISCPQPDPIKSRDTSAILSPVEIGCFLSRELSSEDDPIRATAPGPEPSWLANGLPPIQPTSQSDQGPKQTHRLFPDCAIRPRALVPVNGHGRGLLPKDGLPTSQTFTKDLQDLTHVLNDYWLGILSSITGLPSINARLHKISPFEMGLPALQSCFRGVLPKSFEDIFSLVELAFACAWFIYQDDNSYPWDGFFRDVLEWRHAIEDEQDQCLFSKIAFLIWSPPKMPEAMRQGVVQSESYSLASPGGSLGNHICSTRDDWSPNDVASGSKSRLFQLPLSTATKSQMNILHNLRSGKVIGVCSRYLDAFQYAGIAERGEYHPPPSPSNSEGSLSHRQRVETQIIIPLVQMPEMGGFCDAIMTTTIDLCDGILHDIREVEVSLALNGSRCHESHQAYENFLIVVASLCDSSMSCSNLRWRDRYYAASLDKFQAIYWELERQRRHKLSPIHRSHSPARLSTRACLRLPTFASSIEGTSPTSSTSATSFHSFSNASLHTTSSDTSTQPSSLDSSPTGPLPSPSQTFSISSISPVPTLCCSTCSQPFKGVYRTANLQRHMRNTHQRREKLVCPEPGCGVECSRTDNLRKHRKGVHGIVDKMIRQSTPRHDRRKTY